jgi:hypothetical protein
MAVKIPSKDNLYDFAEAIIPRLRLDRNESGQTCLKLVKTGSTAAKPATGIIYKKAHFISNRYFIVTVSQESANTKISAFEPDKD